MRGTLMHVLQHQVLQCGLSVLFICDKVGEYVNAMKNATVSICVDDRKSTLTWQKAKKISNAQNVPDSTLRIFIKKTTSKSLPPL